MAEKVADIKAVIFDLFGTMIYLTDKTVPYKNLFIELGLRTPDEYQTAAKIAQTENLGLADLAAKLNPNARIDLDAYDEAVKKEVASARLFPETLGVLEELRKRKIITGCISNLASPYKKTFFDLGLDKHINRIIFSCDVGFKKPDQAIYGMMLERLNIEPIHVLMTGDKVSADVEGPRLSGMQAILLNRTGKSLNSIINLEGIYRYL